MSRHTGRSLWILLVVALLLLVPTWVAAQGPGEAPALAAAEQSPHADAAIYAAEHGISLADALRRFALQDAASELDAALSRSEPTFAGLWIEHSPDFRVVVQFAGEPPARLADLAGHDLGQVLDVRRAALPLAVLEQEHAALMAATAGAGLQIESDLIVQENRIELYVADAPALDAALASGALALSPVVRVVPVARIGNREVSIYGGLSLSGGCTSGYSVKNSSGTRGITTAAHCSNTQSYSGTSLPYKAGNISGAYDVQWHTAPGFTVTNKIRTTTGGSTRSITATRSRANQTVGYYVCKYGKTTGYTCGYISSKSYNWDNKGSSTYIRVNNGSSSYPNLSEGGDSGGPWFNSNTAFGTHVGAPGSDANDAVYMAINYVSGISVSVMTAP